jgi:xanthine dehydrogenase YagT iron-sulfur-binding subunit
MSSNEKKDGVTRRGFLKGAGLAAAGSAMLDGATVLAQEARKSLTGDRAVGPGAVEMTLHVNGSARKISAEPRTTLAEALREHLDLTGTKVVCDRGSCSACTVWLDGTPVNSCMTLALDAVGKKITTIEGLATATGLHPVQEAFIASDAMQCGFCTPGMVMSCAALLGRNAAPTLEEVREATSGNLCRCGTYPKVFEATLQAAKSMKRS